MKFRVDAPNPVLKPQPHATLPVDTSSLSIGELIETVYQEWGISARIDEEGNFIYLGGPNVFSAQNPLSQELGDTGKRDLTYCEAVDVLGFEYGWDLDHVMKIKLNLPDEFGGGDIPHPFCDCEGETVWKGRDDTATARDLAIAVAVHAAKCIKKKDDSEVGFHIKMNTFGERDMWSWYLLPIFPDSITGQPASKDSTSGEESDHEVFSGEARWYYPDETPPWAGQVWSSE
jgi:hypothetical protein